MKIRNWELCIRPIPQGNRTNVQFSKPIPTRLLFPSDENSELGIEHSSYSQGKSHQCSILNPQFPTRLLFLRMKIRNWELCIGPISKCSFVVLFSGLFFCPKWLLALALYPELRAVPPSETPVPALPRWS